MILPEVNKVLSTQSHVVHGYVGNKSATFPLQTLGWDVDVINTVNFSNHTGYGFVRGTKTSPEELEEIYQGLKGINVNYDAFLTGYTPSAETLQVVGEIGHDLKEKNPNILWLLDPVMGDEGELYVSETVIPIYRKTLLKGDVDIITPNQFEAELIVDFKITDKESLKKALKELHYKFKVRDVVISSLKFDNQEDLKVVSSTSFGNEITTSCFQVPYIGSYFTGVGDLFSALLLDRVFKYSKKCQSSQYLEQAVSEVLSIMSKVLTVTSQAAKATLGDTVKTKMGSAATMKEAELRLVECRDYYATKEQKFKPSTL